MPSEIVVVIPHYQRNAGVSLAPWARYLPGGGWHTFDSTVQDVRAGHRAGRVGGIDLVQAAGGRVLRLAAPVLPAGQRHLVRGLTMGAVKG